MKIKVLTYNVHKFFDITRTTYFLSQLKETLSKMDLDFVFLQEIPGLQPEKHKKKYDADPLEHLADGIWDHYAYGKNAIYTTGNHGNAILSKYPFIEWKNHDISNHRLEKRGFMIGRVDIKKMPIYVCCTHLDLTSVGRTKQIQKIEKYLEEETNPDQPLIFCGDFNDWRGMIKKFMQHRSLECVSVQVKDGEFLTFPSFYPMLSLDRIFYRNATCAKVKVLTDPHWKKLSDHLPIYAEFTFDGLKSNK